MDLTLRQSLATYSFRSKADRLEPVVTAVEDARGDEEALIATIDREVQIADGKLRAGEAAAATGVLRRAHGIIDEAMRAKRPDPSPVGQAALGTVHLHMCALLSRLGRHHQALDEARAGCLATEELWRIMAKAVADAEESEITCDSSKPIPALKKLLRCPPKWLEQAVETTVHVRQACAVEAELLGQKSVGNVFQFHQRGVYRKDMSDGRGASAAELDCGTRPPDFRGGWAKEVDRLHDEAMSLAQNLLHEEHPVRLHAEKVHAKRAARRVEAAEIPSEPTRAASPSGSRPASRANVSVGEGRPASRANASVSASRPGSFAIASVSESFDSGDLISSEDLFLDRSVLWKKDTGRLPKKPEGAMFGSMGMSPAMKQMSATMSTTASSGGFMPNSSSGFMPNSTTSSFLPSGMASSRRSSKSMVSLPSPPTPRAWPRGDVYTVSVTDMPPRRRRKSLQTSQSTQHGSQTEKKVDPFKEWTRMMDKNRMSYSQYLSKSLDGQVKLRGELKDELRYFKIGPLKSANDDELFENREIFGDFGVAAEKKKGKREERWRRLVYQPSAKELLVKANDENLVANYGVKLHPKKGVDLPGLVKCLRISQERTPFGQAEIQRQHEEARRRAEEERQKMIDSFGAAAPKDEKKADAPAGVAGVSGDVQQGVQKKLDDVRAQPTPS